MICLRGATTRPLCANYYLIRLAVTSSHAPTVGPIGPSLLLTSCLARTSTADAAPSLDNTTISTHDLACSSVVPSSIFAHRASGPPPRHGCLYLGTACANSARLCAHEFIASSLFRKKNPKKGVTMSPVLVLVVKLANLGDIRCAR